MSSEYDYYEPEEDSRLLVQCITKLANTDFSPKTALDVGIGSGILAKAIHDVFPEAKITGIDINKKAIAHCKKNYSWLTVKESDIFQNLFETKFDLIVCNPPYLPEHKFDPNDEYTKALVGGKKGYEYILRFLDQAYKHLNKGGKILLLFSLLSNKTVIDTYVHHSLYLVTQVAQKNVGMMEELFVYELTVPDAVYILQNPIFVAKGKRGLVVKGKFVPQGLRRAKTVAMKLAIDKNRTRNVVGKEAQMLQTINKLSIGPKYITHSSDFVMMEFIEGLTLKDYFKTATKWEKQKVCSKIMEQCQKLDEAGINKFEMTKPLKNILVKKSGVPILLDFERALYTKRPKNGNQFKEFCKNKF